MKTLKTYLMLLCATGLMLGSQTLAAVGCLPLCIDENVVTEAEKVDACCPAPTPVAAVQDSTSCTDCATPCCTEPLHDDWLPERNQTRVSQPVLVRTTPRTLWQNAPKRVTTVQSERPPDRPRLPLYSLHCSLLN